MSHSRATCLWSDGACADGLVRFPSDSIEVASPDRPARKHLFRQGSSYPTGGVAGPVRRARYSSVMATPADVRPFDADNHYYEALDAFTRHLDPKIGPRTIQWADIGGRKYHVIAGA